MRARMIAAVAIAIVVSSCDKKAEGQTVAIVNGEEITATELNAELANANIPATADKEQARARILQMLVDRRLMAQHARAEGLDKSPEFVQRQRRLNEDLLISMLASRQVNTAQLPSAQEIARFQASRPGMFARREQWNLQQLRFEMPASPQVRAQFEAAKTLDELAKVLTDNRITFARAQVRLDTATIPPELYGRLATLPPGEPFIIPIGNQAVASVIASREPAALEGERARPIAVAAIRREQGNKFMQDRLKSLKASAKVEYKAGFAPPAQPQQ
jgi:EpsD family peptidyl-prolyl cis-trans isomerase